MGYTEESVQALRNTLTIVQGVLDDPASTTADLKAARGRLNAAVAALIKKGPNRDEYKKSIADEIAKAEAKDLKGYTAQSVQAFKDALIYAKAVLNNQEASEADYKEALAKLKDASAALRKTEQDKQDNNTDQNKDSDGGIGDSISQAADTGDPAQPIILAVIMLISLAAGMVLLLRKRRREE